ncbi:olfactory receptor 14C36-like [Alligator mississippiensis]|uniref:olfactory receptor 14C36-like n=1 Tax=Alligator mississippiensis TaxID=8496 RepID=UPI002877B44B|nr:olfactory receptor 14C36-like [Alligator mississippiensis]
MAYDRYVAICKPLHYETIMSRRACVQTAAMAWVAGLLQSAMHTGSTFTVTFCKGNIVNQFFCEIPHLIKLSCSDSYLREFGVLALSVLLALSCFIFIMVSYVHIFTTILRLPSEQGRYKAFSTCIPHITMVSLYLINGTFAHMKPPSLSPSSLDLILAILYSVVPAMMNPIIYGLRNKDITVALKKMIQ